MNASWHDTTVGNILRLEYGKPLPASARDGAGMYPVYGANGEKDRSNQYFRDSATVIVGRKGSAGELTLTESRYWPLDVTYYVAFDPQQYELGFVYYLLKSLDLPHLAKGVKPGLNRNDVYRLTARVTNIAEQRRVVGILDKTRDGIATAVANTETCLNEAREIYGSFLQASLERRGPDWSEDSLGALATFRNGINFTRGSKGESVSIVGVGDFQDAFWAPLDDLTTVTIDGTLPAVDALKEDDLLFVRSNGNVDLIGRCLLVGPVSRRVTHSGFTIRARLHDDRVMPRYLCHYLKTRSARRAMIAGGIGTNIKSLNQTTLSSLVVPLPPPRTQARLVEELESLEADVAALTANYRRKVAELRALEQSILYHVFDGTV